MTDYRDVNRAHWDERAPAHAASARLRLCQLRQRPTPSEQGCALRPTAPGRHLGLARCPPAVPHRHRHRVSVPARRANDRARPVRRLGGPGQETRPACRGHVDFVVSDVYDAVDVLGPEQFDLVFTGIGALCWLPSIARWAEVVANLLKPGGRLFLREAHPVLGQSTTPAATASWPSTSATSSRKRHSSGTSRARTSRPTRYSLKP